MEEQLSWDSNGKVTNDKEFNDDRTITISKEIIMESELESIEIDMEEQVIIYRFNGSNDTYLSTNFGRVVIR